MPNLIKTNNKNKNDNNSFVINIYQSMNIHSYIHTFIRTYIHTSHIRMMKNYIIYNYYYYCYYYCCCCCCYFLLLLLFITKQNNFFKNNFYIYTDPYVWICHTHTSAICFKVVYVLFYKQLRTSK